MNKNLLKRLLIYTKPYRIYLILTLICAIGSVLLTLTGPVLIGKAVDMVVAPGNVNFGGLPKILLTFLCTFTGSAMLQWCMTYFSNIITHRTVKDLRGQLFEKLNKIPLKFIDTTPHGDIINRAVNDIDMVSDALLKGFTQLFTGITTILSTLIFMLTASPLITLAVVLLTPVSLFVASFIARGSYKYFTRQTVTQGELTGYINEYIGNLRLVKTFNHEEKTQEGFEKINSDLYSCGLRAQFYSAMTNPCTRFVNGLVYAAVGIIGAVSAINGHITVGQVSMFLSYANQYTKPFNEISGIIAQLQSAFASAKRVFDIIDQPEEIDDVTESINNDCDGDIELNNVYFSYSEDKKLIENLSLSVKSGDRIAIVGPTGCGKTTLINLLMRFYDINSGAIIVDGTDIRDMKRSDLRSRYGMVLQETWLFTGSVRDNITYGIDGVSQEQIEFAAKQAHAHNFIELLPNGYDTVISEDGGNISQGQKQLLCIARAMMLDTPMLILDEATSNIDTRTEIAIQRAFAKMMKGRTSFIVAHRLSTIREADQILVMDKGKIIEQGTHDELLNSGGFYSQLFNAMSS
jgi:ABC-type multidrug transport system, ATPase and permease components